MTTAFAIKTIIETVLVLLIIAGYFNEEKLIAYEDEWINVIKFIIRKRRAAKTASSAPMKKIRVRTQNRTEDHVYNKAA